MNLKDLIFQILFAASCGLFVTLPFVRSSLVGRSYFVYHGLGAIACCLLIYVFVGHTHLSETSPAFLLFLVCGTAFSLLAGSKTNIALAFYFGALVCGILSVSRLLPNSLALANFLGSVLLTGFAMASMWLGHWYLVQPKLSINELSRVTGLLILITILRFLWGSYVGGGILRGMSETEIYHYLLSSPAGIFVLMRYCWGLMLPLALCYFIWGTVRIRSTQSATGLLYVMVLSVLTGETLSQYLALAYAIYL